MRLLGSALEDLEIGADFYERQAPGIGIYFKRCLIADIDSLERLAGIHRQVFGLHRLLSKRFPYAIYYRVEPRGVAVVYRVLDCRRNPASIGDSLESE